MPPSSPYQPALLRILHGSVAVLTVLALMSGFWVYSIYDGRWGNISLPKLEDSQGIHGTIGLTFLLILPIFALYSFHLGFNRLGQEQSFKEVIQVNTPVGWISTHRLANTLMLLASTGAVVTGRMMKEEWLPAGEIDHSWYLAHLVAWAVMFFALALHVLLGIKVGGVPLLLSMFKIKTREQDSPRSWLRGIKVKHSSLVLTVTEAVVIGGIIAAFILPVFNL
ncbi:MAG TPA: cytochrome b/b6 domain-containing protein [Candidatus Obscuribacterales bacterium]